MTETETHHPFPATHQILASYHDAVTNYRHDHSENARDALLIATQLLEAAVLLLPGRFPLGQIVATPGAFATLEFTTQIPAEFLLRHKQGDWGELAPPDQLVNEGALARRGRVVSTYRTHNDDPLWVITDAGWEVTTLLIPEEY